MMETSPNQIIPFIQFVLSLNPTELTTFYCDRCHERLNGSSDTWPTDPFQEASGQCSHCERSEDISNPYVNQFLNENGISLDPNDNDPSIEARLTFPSIEARLIRNWLIPFDYTRTRENDKYYKEEAVSTWVDYGKRKAKQVRRSLFLDERAKSLLTEFYHMRYNVSCFNANPIVEPVNVLDEIDRIPNPVQTVSVTALYTGPEQQDEQVDYERPVPVPIPPSNEPIGYGPLIGKGWGWSTFEQIRAFVSNILQRWKGERNEKDS